MAATELAVLLPLLLVTVLIVADFSRASYTLATLSDSARAGALYYATQKSATQAGAQQAALADAADLQPAPTVTVTTGVIAGGHSYVRVTVSYEFSAVIPNLGVSATTPLSRTVEMLVNPP